MNAASFSKLGYLKLKKESAAGTAVKPDTLFEILSEGIAVNWDWESIEAIAGSRSKSLRPTKLQVGPFTGTIELYVEQNTIGHILCGLLGEDTHSTVSAGVDELSSFEPLTTLPTYTLDIRRAGKAYVNRFFGCRFSKVAFTIDKNRLKATLTVVAQRVFTNARLTVAHSSGTALDLDQTSGLTTTDSLLVYAKAAPATLSATLTIASITSETALVSSTIGASLAVDDIVCIAADTVDDEDFVRAKELIFVGGATVAAGLGPNGLQALSARTNVEDFSLEIENGYEAKWAATGDNVIDRMPSQIMLKDIMVSGKFGEFHNTPEWLDRVRSTDLLGLRFKFLGAILAANAAVAATGTLASSGAGTVTVTADTAGEAGNDYAIVLVQGTGALSVSLSGKLITVTLSSTAGSNAVATMATAIDALSGVAATSSGSGNVNTTANPDKVHFTGGLDASQKAGLTLDIPKAVIKPFAPNLGNDDTLMDSLEFTGHRCEYDGREVQAVLRNVITSY